MGRGKKRKKEKVGQGLIESDNSDTLKK